MASFYLFLLTIIGLHPFGVKNAVPTSAVPAHALYLGVVQVDHKAAGSKADVTIKVFSNDLQSALRNAYPEYRPTVAGESCARNGLLMEQYFSAHFQCAVNGKKLEPQLNGCRQENDVFLLEFLMECPKDWVDIEISADFLMELFPEQSNMITVFHGEQKRFFRMTRVRSSAETDFPIADR